MTKNLLLAMVFWIASILSFLDMVITNKVPPTGKNVHLFIMCLIFSMCAGMMLGSFFAGQPK